MKKYDTYVTDKEFQLFPHKDHTSRVWSEIFLNFVYRENKSLNIVRMTLTKKEWDGLLGFLKKTQNKQLLPKNVDGYSGFIIDQATDIHFSIATDQLIMNAFNSVEKNQRSKKFIISGKQKEYKIIKTKLLTQSVLLRYGQVEVSLPREKFLRFRKFALNASSHFFKQ